MLQSIAYYSNKIQKYWTDENYYGYVFITWDQKRNMGYVGQKNGWLFGRKIKEVKNAN